MQTVKIKNIEQFDAYFRQKTLHPLVSVGNLAYADLTLFDPTDFGMFCIVLMDNDFGTLIKGGHSIHYGPGTIFSLRPGQTVQMQLNGLRPQGWMLAFHPELLEKSGLGRDFYMFNYFDLDVPDAVVLSVDERDTLLHCFSSVRAELHAPVDHLKNHMIRLNIGLLLSCCKRFYERQYAQLREQRNMLMVERLDTLLANYLSSGLAAQHGQPTVAWCAKQFNLSANYFGDVVKRDLHVTARDYIQAKIISAAKHMLYRTPASITEIAQELGFTYPNHFTRQFRRKVGISPSEFRQQNAKALLSQNLSDSDEKNHR